MGQGLELGGSSKLVYPSLGEMLMPFQSQELMFRNQPYLQTNLKVLNSWGSKLLRKLVLQPS